MRLPAPRPWLGAMKIRNSTKANTPPAISFFLLSSLELGELMALDNSCAAKFVDNLTMPYPIEG